MIRSAASLGILAVALSTSAIAQTTPSSDRAQVRATETVKAMTSNEKSVLTHSTMPLPFLPNAAPPPPEAIPGAGYVPALPRLGIPALTETDASLGVSWVNGIRRDGATALPSGLAQASSWNPKMLYDGGQ